MNASIPLDLIDVPPKWRKADRKLVATLADSLRAVGLLHPIGVRPAPGDTGRHLLVFGRHRLDAARLAGWDAIDCKVFEGLDDRYAQAITGAENVFRSELKPAEKILALKLWHSVYAADHPDTSGHRAGGLAGSAGRWGKEEGGDAGADEPEPTFVEHVAAQTGMTRTNVEKFIYAGRNLAEDQLEVLATHAVPKDHIKAINKLDPEQIRTVISLVAGGLDARTAIADATLPASATLTLVGGPEDPRDERDMTDEEWLADQCSNVLERLRYKVAFVSDALLYRHTRDARQKLRAASKQALSQTKVKTIGPFYRLFSQFINVDHPKNWLPCGPCSGSGNDGSVGQCGPCGGKGYVIRKEFR